MHTPTMMNVIEISEAGGPEVLRMSERALPAPAAGEVLIAVEAAGVNRPDVLQRMGRYDPPKGASDIPGLEISGRVVALGENVTELKEGDAVCALVTGGGYAEYCAAPAQQCLPIPEGLSAVEAATLPETYFTVWSNVFDRARLQPGESFLVHGGTSGIGTTAIQLAKAFGAQVFATAGSDEKCRACRELGADRAINYREEDFAAIVTEETGGKGVDVVLDMVGGEYVARNISCMAVEGRHVTIAFLQGPKVQINLVPVMTKRMTLTGSALRARPVSDKAAIADQLREKVWPLFAAGKLRPVVHSVFPMEEATKAHALMESNAHIGKIALTTG